MNKYYVAYFRSSLGYSDECSGLEHTDVEARDEEEAKSFVKSEHSFCRHFFYVRTEGHRDLTEEERDALSDCERGEGAYDGIERYNDPKNEPVTW